MKDIVLVGVDGSPESLVAARWALAEAAARHWSIWFATVSAPAQVADPQVEMAYRQSAAQTADLLFADLKAAAQDHGVDALCSLRLGQASEVLVDLSARAGLSVVGHRDRGGFTSRLGSVASALAAHAHCPTAVIPAGQHSQPNPADDRPAADLSRFAGDIVAAVEQGPAATAVLSAAADMAHRHNRPLNAVTVDPDPEGQEAIGNLLARLQVQHQGLKCSVHTLSGPPVHEITKAARDSWLLVVGSRGIAGLPGMVRGSVSQALLQLVASPVLVVPNARADAPDNHELLKGSDGIPSSQRKRPQSKAFVDDPLG